MNKYLLSLFLILCFTSVSKARIVTGAEFVDDFNEPEIIIEPGSSVFSKNTKIDLLYDTHLINKGTINGNINLAGRDLIITNSGIIEGNIINTADAKSAVLQNISNNSELQKLSIGSNNIDLVVDIKSVNNLSLSELQSLSAQKYIIEDSNINIDDLSEWNDWNTDIVFSGNNVLKIKNANLDDVIKHIVDMQNVNIEFDEKIDNLHKLDYTNTKDGVIINIVRETEDYTKIMNDSRGILLDKLHNNKKDKHFMNLIDSAENMQEIENVMNKSYHFNQKILTRPLYINNSLLMIDFINEQYDTDIAISANYTGGNKINGFSGKAGIANKYNNLSFGIGLNLNKLNYKDNVNDFDVLIFSPELKFAFNKDNYWVKAKAGLSFARYNAKDIYDDKDIVNNPRGNSKYGILNLGYDFDVFQDLKLSVFSGADFQYTKVLDAENKNINLIAGSKIKYSYEMIGIKYDFAGMIATASNGDLMTGMEIGCFSVLDEIGAYVKIDAYQNQYDFNYNASVNIKTMF